MAWWILEQSIRPAAREVRVSLEKLVQQGLVIAERAPDGRIFYYLPVRRKPANGGGTNAHSERSQRNNRAPDGLERWKKRASHHMGLRHPLCAP